MAYNIVASGTTANLINLEELKASVNGNLCKLAYINSNALKSNITLPAAPTIYPHDTVLTPEQIASGVIKHADASNSGLIVNGKFDTDTSGWSALRATISAEGGKIRVTPSINSTPAYGYQAFTTIIGKEYIAEVNFLSSVSNLTAYVRATNTAGGAGLTGGDLYLPSPFAYGAKKLKFTASATTTYINVGVYDDDISSVGYAEFNNIAVYPADAISRSDLVFLESWHEDISDKNIVYPLGNVQYLGANSDGLTGIANGAFTGFETYSLFGFVN